MYKPTRGLALSIAMLSISMWSASASAEPERRASHVIVIGVDGLSPDGVKNAQTPNIDEMMNNGSWSMGARGVFLPPVPPTGLRSLPVSGRNSMA